MSLSVCLVIDMTIDQPVQYEPCREYYACMIYSANFTPIGGVFYHVRQLRRCGMLLRANIRRLFSASSSRRRLLCNSSRRLNAMCAHVAACVTIARAVLVQRSNHNSFLIAHVLARSQCDAMQFISVGCFLTSFYSFPFPSPFPSQSGF